MRPLTRAWPMAKPDAPAMSPGGTKENNLSISRRSEAAFMRIRTRLSHWETISSCTFPGR